MAMRCPNCSNEISLEEVFCGQCGTPVILSAKSTGTINGPQNHQGLLNSGYNSIASSTQGTRRPGTLPSTNDHPSVMSTGLQQQSGYYQDPTQAMSVLPPNQAQNYQTVYPQQTYGSPPTPGGYAEVGNFTPRLQPFQSGNFTGTLYPPTQSFPTGQGYGMPPGFTPPPHKKRSNLALIVISICITLAIITIFAIGITYLLGKNAPDKTQPAHLNATSTSIPTPTTVPSPSPTPSPTLTPTPDTGFTLCDTTCTSNGFSVEYPSAWLPKTTNASTGMQFTNASQADEFAAFKTPGATTMNAGQLVNTDLNNFSSLQGYIAPTPTPSSNATIGGENWSYQIAYYQLNGQAVRIEDYATVHQGKAYIIELQAFDSQFDAVNAQYFERMLVRFQFQ
jgi:zinc-ribbon domain